MGVPFSIIISIFGAALLFCMMMSYTAPSCSAGKVPALTSPKMWACVRAD